MPLELGRENVCRRAAVDDDVEADEVLASVAIWLYSHLECAVGVVMRVGVRLQIVWQGFLDIVLGWREDLKVPASVAKRHREDRLTLFGGAEHDRLVLCPQLVYNARQQLPLLAARLIALVDGLCARFDDAAAKVGTHFFECSENAGFGGVKLVLQGGGA